MYNPLNIISNIRLYLNDKKMKEMVPLYKRFKGIVEKYKKKIDLGDDEEFFVKSV
jgi:hypothetical protein